MNKPESIDSAVAAFLANGGQIQQIARNVSGWEKSPVKTTTWGKLKKVIDAPAVTKP